MYGDGGDQRIKIADRASHASHGRFVPRVDPCSNVVELEGAKRPQRGINPCRFRYLVGRRFGADLAFGYVESRRH